MPDSSAQDGAVCRNRSRVSLRIAVSYFVAGGCLFWVFHNIHAHEFLAAMSQMRWPFLILCVALEFTTYFCVAWEWQLLLRPVGTLSLPRTMQAVLAGRFANDALPLQIGYIVRATLAARWIGAEVISVFPSLIIERLWDGIWLAAGIGIVALWLPLPPAILHAATVLGTIVLAGTVAAMFFTLRASKTAEGEHREAAHGIYWRMRSVLQRLTGGMRDIGRSNLLSPVLGLSVLKLAIQAAAFLVLLRAYNLHLPLPVSLAVFLMGYLGLCIPSTPAGTGMFQVFVVAGLTLFGITKSIAAGFALVGFIVITVPLALAGFFALAQSGVRLSQVRGQPGS